jgi:hypothetical protein
MDGISDCWPRVSAGFKIASESQTHELHVQADRKVLAVLLESVPESPESGVSSQNHR